MPLLSAPCSRKERAATERMFSWFCALCSGEYRMRQRVRPYSTVVKFELILLGNGPRWDKNRKTAASGSHKCSQVISQNRKSQALCGTDLCRQYSNRRWVHRAKDTDAASTEWVGCRGSQLAACLANRRLLEFRGSRY